MAQLKMKGTIEIERFNADGGIERALEGLDASHEVVVGGRVIDGADAAAERFEQEGKVAIPAAQIEHRQVADERLEIAVAAGEQALEQSDGAEAVPGVPSGIGRREFAPDAAQAILEGQSAGGEVADFELLDERPRAQAPLPVCERHGEGH